MRILIFSQYYYPERFLIHQIAEKLVADGNEVTVITGLPNYGFPGGKIPDEYKKGRIQENINGVNVLRCKMLPRKTSKLTLLLSYFSYLFKANARGKKLREKFDVVFCYQLTPITQLYPAIRYCRKHRLKLLCYCLDLAPSSGVRLLKRFPLSRRIYCRYSKWAYQNCDRIAVTSRAFIEYLNRVNGIETGSMIYLPQHAPENLLAGSSEKKHNGLIRFIFAGNLGGGARLETIVYAIKELTEMNPKPFLMEFIGEGSAKEELVELTSELQLERWISFRDPVPFEKMPEVYETADALVLTLRKGQVTIPGKLQAYMASGKPVLAAIDGSGKELIEESRCGKATDAEDRHGLALLLNEYLNDPQAFDWMGSAGREYFKENFTLDIFSQRLEAVLHELADNHELAGKKG